MHWLRSKEKPNEQWFESLVHLHIDELTAFAFRLCGSREQAEDLVQEAFTEAWNGISSLKEVDSARAWLFRVLRRRYARLVRNKLTRPELVLVDDSGEDLFSSLPSREPDPYRCAAASDYLEKVLSTLGENFRVPLLMATMEGLTAAQISKELGVPVGTVLSRIHRARQSLQVAARELEQTDTETKQRASATILEVNPTARERKQHGS